MFSCPLFFMKGGDNLKKVFLMFVALFLFTFNSTVYASSTTEENNKKASSIPFVEPYNADTYGRYNGDEIPPDMTFENEKNEKGVIVSGAVFAVVSGYTNSLGTICHQFHCTGLGASEGLYFTYHPNATDCGGFFILHGEGTKSKYVRTVNEIRPSGDPYVSSGVRSFDSAPLGYTIYPISSCSIDTFCTNIPIFDPEDTEGIEKYLNGGDYSSATNADDVDNGSGASENNGIEKPVGLKVSGGYASGLSSAYTFKHDFVGHWTQTVDTSDYVYDIQAQCIISEVVNSGSSVKTGKSATSNWVDFGRKSYGGVTSMTHTISEKNLNDKLFDSAMDNYVKQYGKLKYKGYIISKLRIRIKNFVDTKSSDWVVITIDYDGATTTATVEDDDGNIKEDDEYNGGDVADKDNDTSGESIESGIASILDYIRSGFGLLGNGGVIDLMARCFVYLPASIWTMIKFLVAMMVFMAVISLIKKFVF